MIYFLPLLMVFIFSNSFCTVCSESDVSDCNEVKLFATSQSTMVAEEKEKEEAFICIGEAKYAQLLSSFAKALANGGDLSKSFAEFYLLSENNRFDINQSADGRTTHSPRKTKSIVKPELKIDTKSRVKPELKIDVNQESSEKSQTSPVSEIGSMRFIGNKNGQLKVDVPSNLNSPATEADILRSPSPKRKSCDFDKDTKRVKFNELSQRGENSKVSPSGSSRSSSRSSVNGLSSSSEYIESPKKIPPLQHDYDIDQFRPVSYAKINSVDDLMKRKSSQIEICGLSIGDLKNAYFKNKPKDERSEKICGITHIKLTNCKFGSERFLWQLIDSDSITHFVIEGGEADVVGEDLFKIVLFAVTYEILEIHNCDMFGGVLYNFPSTMKKLIINNCGFTKIDWTNNLIGLKYLDFSNNKFTTSPPESMLGNLICMKLDNNAIDSIDKLPKKLEFLSLKNCSIKNLNKCLSSIKGSSVKALELSSNCINLNDFRNIKDVLANIEELYINNNNFAEIMYFNTVLFEKLKVFSFFSSINGFEVMVKLSENIKKVYVDVANAPIYDNISEAKSLEICYPLNDQIISQIKTNRTEKMNMLREREGKVEKKN